MVAAREFPAGVVLSISTGRLVCDFSDLHEAIQFLIGGPVFTHQLPRAFGIIQPALSAAHPELDLEDRFGAGVFDGIVDADTAAAWIQIQIATHGVRPTYELSAAGEYAMSFSDPIGDLAAMRPDASIVVVRPEADR